MKVLGIIESASILTVYLANTIPLDECTLDLYLLLPKKNETRMLSLPYDPRILVYTFDISEMRPSILNYYDFGVKITDSQGNEIENYPIKIKKGTRTRLLPGHAKSIIKDFIVVAKNLNGSKIEIFKRLNSKEKCEICWDEDMLSSNDSNCPNCDGLGEVITYSYAHKTYAGAVQSTSNSILQQQEGMTSNYSLDTIPLPALVVLDTGDIIFYHSTGVWYYIDTSVNIASLGGFSTLQTVAVHTLPSHAPEVEFLSKRRMETIDNKWR